MPNKPIFLTNALRDSCSASFKEHPHVGCPSSPWILPRVPCWFLRLSASGSGFVFFRLIRLVATMPPHLLLARFASDLLIFPRDVYIQKIWRSTLAVACGSAIRATFPSLYRAVSAPVVNCSLRMYPPSWYLFISYGTLFADAHLHLPDLRYQTSSFYKQPGSRRVFAGFRFFANGRWLCLRT